MSEQKNKVKKYNFLKIECKDLEGKPLVFNVARNLADKIYRTTGNLSGLDLAQRMHKEGEIELSEEDKSILAEFINNEQCEFIAIIKVAILKMIKN